MKNSKLILIELSILFVFVYYFAKCGSNVIANDPKSIVCFWNTSLLTGKLKNDDIREAADLCTHLVYGFADVDTDSSGFKATIPNSRDLAEKISDWKQEFPQLRIYLSVGESGKSNDILKYLTVLETLENRNSFINSVIGLVKTNKFDGVDLAWPFPPKVQKKNTNLLKTIWKATKSLFVTPKFVDTKIEQHRDQFTSLVRDLKNQLRNVNKNLTLTILPGMNVSAYYDISLLTPNFDAVHLMDFDQKTAAKSPQVADYPAPIYDDHHGDDHDENIDFSVSQWVRGGTPKSKIIVGVPTYARTWKLTSESQASGVPPLLADGPGTPGYQSRTSGLLSYSEVCTLLKEPEVEKFTGANKKYGNYAFKLPKGKNVDGIWVGYEDSEFVKTKCSYVKSKSLGGMAVSDLSTDDIQGACSDDKEKFPILRTIKNNL